MDYVPAPSNYSSSSSTLQAPLEVPYVARFPYDFLGYEDFPSRLGFMRDECLDLQHRSMDDCISLLQSWLYFGLLAEFAGRPINIWKVIHPSFCDKGIQVVRWDTQFEVLLQDQKHRVSSLTYQARTAATHHISSCIRVAATFIEHFDQMNCHEGSPLPAIVLSTKILLITLSDHLGGLGMENPTYLPLLRADPHAISATTKFLMSRMNSAGWCPFQIQRACSTFNCAEIYYLSQIDRKKGIRGENAHNNCCKTQCVANNVDMTNYTTKHRKPDCSCHFIVTSTEPLVDTIRKGGVPLISVHTIAHGGLEIRVSPASPSSPYTAISHVWSDGLGNPCANALPQCQLQWLLECLGRLPREGERGISCGETGELSMGVSRISNIRESNPIRSLPLFWIDTLCIPVAPEYAELRTKAINRMAPTYAQADNTLILDSELQQVRLATSCATEILVYLAYCAWTARCWTFQEGAISKECYFQFADGAIQPDGVSDAWGIIGWLLSTSASKNSLKLIYRALREAFQYRGEIYLMYKEIITDLLPTYVPPQPRCTYVGPPIRARLFQKAILKQLRVGRRNKKLKDIYRIGTDRSRLEQFVITWNAMAQRSTTQAKDLFIILANLVDLNAGLIMKLPAEERVRAILYNFNALPLALLYNPGPRLTPGGNRRDRWIPTIPRGIKLENDPSMTFKDGVLTIESSSKSCPNIFLFKLHHIKDYCFLQDAESKKTFFVKAFREVVDELDISHCITTCVIIEKQDSKIYNGIGLEIKGACLHITDIKAETDVEHDTRTSNRKVSFVKASSTSNAPKDVLELHAIYDCPLSVWEVENSNMVPETEAASFKSLYPSLGGQIVELDSFKGPWTLIIISEKTTQQTPLPRRDFPISPDLLLVNLIFSYITTFFMAWPSYIIFFIIAAQSANSFTVLGIFAIVLIVLGFIQVFLSLIGVIIFLVDRARTDRFDTLTIWFCVLWFGRFVPTLLFGSFWHAALKKYSYSAWLETFEEDWPNITRYRIWWRLMAFDKKVFGWGSKMMNSMILLPDWFENWIDEITKIGRRKEIEVEEEVEKDERANDMRAMLEHDRAIIKKFML